MQHHTQHGNVPVRASKYISKMRAMAGAQDSAGAAAAEVLCIGFGLDKPAAQQILMREFGPRCMPTLTEAEIDKLLDQAVINPLKKQLGWLLAEPQQHPEGLTDLGNAMFLIRTHGEDLRFCHDFDRWYLWDGRRWKLDRTGGAMRMTFESIRKHQKKAVDGNLSSSAREKLIRHLLRSENASRLNSILELACNLTPIPILPEQFDINHWIINCLNGTLDLRSGILYDHRRGDLNTKLVPFDYDPEAKCPKWIEFLNKVLAGNKKTISFIQRMIGYSITGNVSEHCMAILFGDGRNGKSTFIEIIRHVMNDYAVEAAPGLLVSQRNPAHPTEIADLQGARFASSSEIGRGEKLDEPKFKRLTGEDALKARRMYQDFFQFEPTHKFWMSTNNKPVIRETKEAVWRRLFLIPFLVIIPEAEVDKKLREKLKSEASGILAWMVRGCRAWQVDGLNPPDEVLQATANYKEEMDDISQFIRERCVVEKVASCGATQLFGDYKAWCEEQGLRALSQKLFGAELKSRKELRSARNKVGRTIYEGIRIRSSQEQPSLTTGQSIGLTELESVTAVEFLEAKCVVHESLIIDCKLVYIAYADYCRSVGRPEMAMLEIDEALESRGFAKDYFEDGCGFRRLGLLTDHPSAPEPSEVSAAAIQPEASTPSKERIDPSDPSKRSTPAAEQDFFGLIE